MVKCNSEHRRRPVAGIALLLAVIAAGVLSIGASVVLLKIDREAGSERIREYNFIIESYRTALTHFNAMYNRLPKQLQELIVNEKAIPLIRHLYNDPFTGGPLSIRRNLAGEIEDVYSEAAARLSQEY